MTRLMRRLAATGLAAVFGLQAACAASDIPATGQRAFTVMSPADEVRIGREQHPQVLAEFGGAYDDARLVAYVEDIGRRLVAVSETPQAPFTFTVIDSDIVNAFALPGGYVYVTRGLVALAENEAELAGVLAHEIGHVTARHAAQRATRATWAQLGLLGATILGGALGGGAVAEGVAQLGGVGAMAWVQGYSREQEFEADQLGVRYLARAGYEPRAMAGFLQALGDNDRLQRRLAGADEAERPPSWLASHPRTVDRVQRAAVEADQEIRGSDHIGREPFMRAIDGMIFGDDPRQGVVRERRFLHPGLGFAFEVAPGWRLANQPQEVIGRGPDGRAMVFDLANVRRGVAMDAYIADGWAAGTQLHGLRRIRVNGMEAAVARARGSLDNRPAEVELVAIRFDGERVYRFLFVAPGGIAPRDADMFASTVNSFRSLARGEAEQIRPRRIRVVEVRPGDSVESLAGRMAVERLPLDHFLVLNGLAPGQPLQPGRQVKIVIEG